MSSAMINKIHVANTTRLSLNDRFTAISSRVEGNGMQRKSRSRSRSASRSRSHSVNRAMAPPNRAASVANRRLLQQLARKHKMQAALKLKRRSMRTIGGGVAMKRGSVKAFRVAPNGRPIKTNSLTKVATMKADHIINGNNGRRPLRRSNSVSNVVGRLGARRPLVGGAAERIEKRRNERVRGRPVSHANSVGAMRRGRSNSRSRAMERSELSNVRGRSLSRGRAGATAIPGNVRRGRSRSRSRGRISAGVRALPIKARLGVRPNVEAEPRRRGRRAASVSRRGIAQGRVQKVRARNASVVGGRARANIIAGNRGANIKPQLRSRSRSRTRKGSVGQQQQQHQQQQLQQQQRSGAAKRGRRGAQSQQRQGRNGKANNTSNGQQTQRGRSRSRGARNGRGGRNMGGKNVKSNVNKDDLDKELDQYMASPKE